MLLDRGRLRDALMPLAAYALSVHEEVPLVEVQQDFEAIAVLLRGIFRFGSAFEDGKLAFLDGLFDRSMFENRKERLYAHRKLNSETSFMKRHHN